MQFLLPVVFTVGPDVNQRGANAGQGSADGVRVEDAPEDHGDALMKYVMLLAEAEANPKAANPKQHLENIIKGIIEGETRVLVSKYLNLPRHVDSLLTMYRCHDYGRDLCSAR